MPAVVPPAERTRSVLRGVAEQEIARLLAGSRPWTWWLERAARYGRHGFVNTVLIAAQWRFAADVRSYNEWRAAGRYVRKGETGIRILSRNGRTRAVFDIAQTDGAPLPPRALPPDAAYERLRQAAHALGVQADPDPPVVREALTALALRLGRRLLPEHTSSVAYLVLAHLGVRATHLVYPEVRAWAADTGAVISAGDRILRAAAVVAAELEAARAAHACLEAAHAFFLAQAPGGWVPAHLARRGLPADAPVGCAPAAWQALTGHLRHLGLPDDAIIAAGLARRGRGGVLYDRFRDRAMFPLRDARGTIAGFIGRRHGGGGGPKYLNSPESALFRKGRLLYGLHESRDRLAAGARPVIVEGPFDALAINALPAHAGIATCGSTITPEQLRALLTRASAQAGILVALDGDPAGRAAALRAWDVLREVSAPVDVALFEPGDDPAEVLRREGPEGLRRVLEGARPMADLVVDAAVERAGGALRSPEDRAAALRAAASVIAPMAPVHVPRQAGRVAERLDLDHATVTGALVEAVTGDPA
ncbi:toprim domain-containing protein [Thermomonospora cellulosilytica]|uniref:DNA primase n=1 Tax=Thermomonospora cellulosilytica TaxID=1411118 RepID=A0A7W3RCC7_9ACTN|nr:toprim domain-containing protein [Thermomonospora cellulosilytica]MBA9007170.1 DNA primase [Thermomonospora cellulosilytica]